MGSSSAGDITQLLASAGLSDPQAAARVLPHVYRELQELARRRMAEEPPGHTLTATALVHEAYLRVIGDRELKWESRGHFFAAAARAMRRILIDRARKAASLKHGGGRDQIDLGEVAIVTDTPPAELLDLDAALTKLEQIDWRKSEIVNLRFFAGLTIEETALSLGVSPRLVTSEWTFARAWLKRELAGD